MKWVLLYVRDRRVFMTVGNRVGSVPVDVGVGSDRREWSYQLGDRFLSDEWW